MGMKASFKSYICTKALWCLAVPVYWHWFPVLVLFHLRVPLVKMRLSTIKPQLGLELVNMSAFLELFAAYYYSQWKCHDDQTDT